MNAPNNCIECDFYAKCTNPAPYGMYQCIHKKKIEERAITALLNRTPNKGEPK